MAGGETALVFLVSVVQDPKVGPAESCVPRFAVGVLTGVLVCLTQGAVWRGGNTDVALFVCQVSV